MQMPHRFQLSTNLDMKYLLILVSLSLVGHLSTFYFIKYEGANTLLEKFKQAKMLLKLYSQFQKEKSKYLLNFDQRYLAEVEQVINQKMHKTESIKKSTQCDEN